MATFEDLCASIDGIGMRIDDLLAERAAFLDALRMILPFAEEYLAKAPSHPDNAKLETARAVLAKAEGQ